MSASDSCTTVKIDLPSFRSLIDRRVSLPSYTENSICSSDSSSNNNSGTSAPPHTTPTPPPPLSPFSPKTKRVNWSPLLLSQFISVLLSPQSVWFEWRSALCSVEGARFVCGCLVMVLMALCMVLVGVMNADATRLARGALSHRPGQRLRFGASPAEMEARLQPRVLPRSPPPHVSFPSASPSLTHTPRRLDTAVERELHAHLSAAAPYVAPTGRLPRVRFVTTSNRVDPLFCSLMASAAVSGVSLTSVGYRSVYSNMVRLRGYVDFIDAEGLADDDVVVLVDADTVWTGEDVVPFLSKYFRLSPPSRASLNVAAVRAWEDYGELLAPQVMASLLGYANVSDAPSDTALIQMPPILFNGEHSCMRVQTSGDGVHCQAEYDVLEALIGAARNGKETSAALLQQSIRSSGGPEWEVEETLRTVTARLQSGASVFQFFDSRLQRPRGAVDVSVTALALARPSSVSPMPSESKQTRVFARPRTGRASEKRASSDADHTTLPPTPPTTPRRIPYRVNIHGRLISSRHLNSGALVGRVWAVRALADAFDAYVTSHSPREGTGEWFCDQSIIGTMYVHGRVWEVEQGLLFPSTTPSLSTPSASSAPLTSSVTDPFGLPPGLMGIDARSEIFFVHAGLTKGRHYDTTPYLQDRRVRQQSRLLSSAVALITGNAKANETSVELGGQLRGLRRSRSGALLTPSLFRRLPYPFEVMTQLRQSTLTGVRPALFHLPGGWKGLRYTGVRHYLPWFFAARNDPVARAAALSVLAETEVEMWAADGRYFFPYIALCGNPFELI